MREFIAALRQLRCPIVLIAVAILVLQSLVAGLATAHAAARLVGGTEAGLICHGNGDDGGAPSGQAAHHCCTFCTTAGPVALTSAATVVGYLDIAPRAELLAPSCDLYRPARAIRAGPSQAPPIVS